MTKLFQGLTILFCHICLNAQEPNSKLTPTEFTIPASPVFDLMGVTPSQVARTSDVKDFKVDWSFKSWSLSPNISLQSQPFWEAVYNRKDISKYQKASPLMRRLASVDVSLGTVRDESTDRRIGGAVKMTLYKEKDPLLEKDYYTKIEEDIVKEKIALSKQIILTQKQMDTIKNIVKKVELKQELGALELELMTINGKRQKRIEKVALSIIEEYWNSDWFDIGAGKVNAFQTHEDGGLAGKRLNRNSALGLWFNGGVGIGKYFLLSGLTRIHFYDEQVNFSLTDEDDIVLDTIAVGSNRLYTIGANLRYGSPLFAFFTELVYEKRGFKTPLSAIQEVFITPDNLEIVPNSVDWTIVFPYRFNFGGDWRLNKNLMLNYSMQTIFDADFKMRTFLPVVGISCMMR